MNNDCDRVLKGAVKAWSKVLSQNLLEGTDDNNNKKNSQNNWSPRYEAGMLPTPPQCPGSLNQTTSICQKTAFQQYKVCGIEIY